MQRLLFLILSLCLILPEAKAQNTGGQFCVRAFLDTNANQIRDPGEPILPGNISVNLLDDSGAIILTDTLENSTTRASGLVCFNNLPAGQYTVQVVSAVYRPTTSNNLTAAVAPGQIPALLEYGAQSIIQPTSVLSTVDDDIQQQDILERLIVSMIGGFTAVLVMAIVGLLLFAFVIAPRASQRIESSTLPDDYRFRRPGIYTPPSQDADDNVG